MENATTAIIDLREYDFDTMAELENLVHGSCVYFAEHEQEIGGIIITWYQQKLLRLERYNAGIPEKYIRDEILNKVHGVPVLVTEFEKGCPGCGDDVEWH